MQRATGIDEFFFDAWTRRALSQSYRARKRNATAVRRTLIARVDDRHGSSPDFRRI